MTKTSKPEHGVPLVQTMVIAVLFAAPALFCVKAANIQDPDLWWHLRTGQWILEQHALPYTDSFSATAHGEPWAAYSWLFEVLIDRVWNAFGLTGIIGYAACMLVAITAALHHMLRRVQRDFSVCILLTYAAVFSMGHLYTPRPWLWTILLFVLELDVIVTARRTGRKRLLLWLLPVFALWANLHIQFIDGLIVLGLAAGDAAYVAWQRRTAQDDGAAPLAAQSMAIWWAAVLALCGTAACVNPYGWHIYKVAYDLAAQTGVLDKIGELQAIAFRSLVDWVALALALGGAAALARARRVDGFQIVLFGFAIYTGFRSQRDVWLTAIVSAMVMAETIEGSQDAVDRTPVYGVPSAIVAALVAVMAGFPLLKVTPAKLQMDLEKAMPVRAVAYAQQQHLVGPLYNDFTWGGYLIWQLRLPVSMDGRAALYGDPRIDQATNTIDGAPGWASDQTLAAARLVIVSPKAPLAQLLRFDPRFALAYDDATADVFVAR